MGYACCTKTDFTGYGAYLFGALLALTLFGFAVPLLASAGLSFTALNLVFNIVGVLLFVFYIVYDTQLIMGEYGEHKEQFDRRLHLRLAEPLLGRGQHVSLHPADVRRS